MLRSSAIAAMGLPMKVKRVKYPYATKSGDGS
jgi:hypothetical protein